MAAYQRGAKGEEVSRIQGRLRALSFYRGPVDGDFGGGTESAVRAFQQARGLDVDGMVGPQTWQALFDGASIVAPAIVAESLAYRSLALSGAFETDTGPPDCFAGLSGDFDRHPSRRRREPEVGRGRPRAQAHDRRRCRDGPRRAL